MYIICNYWLRSGVWGIIIPSYAKITDYMVSLFYFYYVCTNFDVIDMCALIRILLLLHGYEVDGGWSEWEDISECTASCGTAFKEQNRTCTEPPTSCGGLPCIGSDHRLTLCNTTCCPGLLAISCSVCVYVCVCMRVFIIIMYI